MIINITRKTAIKEVQRKFNIAFPFLKIEFHDQSSDKKGEDENWYEPGTKLFEVAGKKQSGWVILQTGYTSLEFQQLFIERFGLYASIFRKENDHWIEISDTDINTLEELNRVGRRFIEKNRDRFWREREVLL